MKMKWNTRKTIYASYWISIKKGFFLLILFIYFDGIFFSSIQSLFFSSFIRDVFCSVWKIIAGISIINKIINFRDWIKFWRFFSVSFFYLKTVNHFYCDNVLISMRGRSSWYDLDIERCLWWNVGETWRDKVLSKLRKSERVEVLKIL